MKYCPICRTEYADETLQYCLQDGTRLNADTTGTNIVFGEPETVVAPRRNEPMRIDLSEPSASAERRTDELYNQNPPPPVSTLPPPPPATVTTAAPAPNTTRTVLLTVLGTLVLLGALGALGAWFFNRDSKTEVAQNINSAANRVNQASAAAANDDVNVRKTPTPKPTPEANVANGTNAANAANANVANAAAPSTFDRGQIEREIGQSVEDWKSAGETRDLDEYMTYYDRTVDYYSKKSANLDFVRKDKQRALGSYDVIEMNLSNFTVTPDAAGERAVAAFDKEWLFENAAKTSRGKVRSQLSLKKVDGKWLITGERDLKVYYVE